MSLSSSVRANIEHHLCARPEKKNITRHTLPIWGRDLGRQRFKHSSPSPLLRRKEHSDSVAVDTGQERTVLDRKEVKEQKGPLHAGNRQLSSEAEANQTMQSFLLSSVLWNWVEWIAAVTIAAGTAAIGYLAYKRFYVKDHRNKSMVNLHIQKDNPKIVHAFDMEDLGDKAVYCRCWRSKKFPFCDGSHTKHNEETGDNVGPLIIKKKET
ncbi:CDGSH iron-sulfur domain-containing protein 1 isoform X1 [Prionailurus bengalensis]|nr:CDGSH iron-sulfur domain-containing protein 1 isoform X1 [Prionailurus bengalensis]